MFLHFLQAKEDKEAFLELAHVVAKADGFVSNKEQGYLRSFMAEMNLRESDYIGFSKARDLPEIIADLKVEQVKNIFFVEILLLIFADGDYNEEEKQIVMDLKRLFGLSDETYEAFKDWVIRMDKLKIEGVKLIMNSSCMNNG
ncbi:TerB family tellurite resistance protein [Paenibacillus spongiae]|uniref:TerB family tellurite resistance protein n=1 Tax=Paenibacillus spongiae TaxID=2909671 RepID=A0ABY5S2N8_9BACL|nr:TerB family tellurite resistance protein [Paenibacillus spongiae]UVI27934.1 TerB family tellurite resistance protein [Paenibacillus spongiae]